jgi:hypothetical protein
VASYNLTRVQKNQVLEIINAADLDPTEFVWGEDLTEVNAIGAGRRPYTVEVLTHGPTGYAFKFDVLIDRASLWAIFEPGPDGPRKREHAGTWSYVAGYLERWADRVRADHRASDMWAELQQQRELMAGEIVENTSFTDQERAQITAQLREAKEYARANVELDRDQLHRIEAQLDYLVDAADRTGRLDWRNLLVGSFLSQVIQSLLPLAPVQQLLFVVLRGLAAVFGRGQPELPGGPADVA